MTLHLVITFYIQHQIHNSWKKKLTNWTLLELKPSAMQKTLLREWKGIHRPGENFCKTHIWWRTCTQNIQELVKLTNKKSTQLEKWAKYLNSLDHRKYIYRWQASTWKDAQHCNLLGKCKLKCDVTTNLLEC